ncbi:hypothetical protein PAE0353 [Pyrobaculum aerophilum str. IM2]|uniref:Uncharacterized protein n=1 Tax=Pyrobaculum aerophilum (strain ATCC 51768 / DSM 7523 / JCM 9630 / CIP 104966 / NBRC 100827 / IM2) TaxID=178306 RepID=Q8ZZA5_PYRAE|nr:hypothetical protein [Pyrobaculum aerophilum]AAL62736.1 hypothetical protein PAE0353 [Pyrobaculum aerophilum str. IM2]
MKCLLYLFPWRSAYRFVVNVALQLGVSGHRPAAVGIAFVTISLAADFDKVKLLICEARSKPIRLATYALHIAAPLLLSLSSSGFLNWFVGFLLYMLLTFPVMLVALAALLAVIIKARSRLSKTQRCCRRSKFLQDLVL